MTRRYEIQDILTQDANGVVFQAEDRESGQTVVLRRFFPFGPEGGGLQEAERGAYLTALDRLREVRHPTLRTILDGGCDPVDGMPFLVTEWVEGQRLSELLKSRALSPGSTKALITHALEASKELAAAFGEEAIWVEATPESIILPEDGKTLTFWISPAKWLGDPEKRGGLLPLARLAEKALHWRKGKPVIGTAEGLGNWVKAIYENPNRWSLDEALTALNEPLTMTSPPAQMGSLPTVPMPAKKKAVPVAARKKSFVPALMAIVLVLGAAAGGLFFLKNRAAKKAEIAETKPLEIPKGTSALSFGANNEAKQPAKTGNTPVAAPAPDPKPAPAVAAVPDNNSVTGKVLGSEESKSGKTRYLKIEVAGSKDPRWVGYEVSQNSKGLEISDLKAMEKKKVLVHGEEKRENGPRGAVLHIRSRDQIEVLKD